MSGGSDGSGGGVRGALLVAGTTSDAGKSVLTAGLCRWYARRGVRVAPFKAQNMALNSAVTADGAEIGRAQAMQAAAARTEPTADMNPVLLKPGGERYAQLIVRGRAVTEVDALGYRKHKAALAEVVLDSLTALRRRYDVVVCEGAGSPAEINLRDTDIANMGLARAAGLPTIVVGDIDRGGVFASMFGTLALLEAADQALVAGFVVNKFRGDDRLLAPGLRMLRDLTGRPTLGVLPWRPGLWLDAEDALDLETFDGSPHGLGTGPRDGPAGDVLRVAVVRLPRLSNVTDADPLRCEPGVHVRLATRPEELADADLVVLPGTRATVDDLGWLRARGLAAAIADRAAAGRPVLGICGGYQMLGEQIEDTVESGAGGVPGLGLLPVRTVFAARKVLGRPSGVTPDGLEVRGYEIHHGVVTATGGEPFAAEGVRRGAVCGTSWHGLLENDSFRRAFLADVAARAGRAFVPGGGSFAAVRDARLDALADLVADHLDTAAIDALVTGGPPAGLPFVPPGAPAADAGPAAGPAPAVPAGPSVPAVPAVTSRAWGAR